MLARRCNECEQSMVQGYCIEDGVAYYCSDRCLRRHYSKAEWDELYDNGESNSYWTIWQAKDILYAEAKERFLNDQKVYLVYEDGTEKLAEHMDEINWHEGTCGKFVIE